MATCEAMMKSSMKRRMTARMRPLTEKLERSSKVALKGLAGSWIWEGRYVRKEGTRVARRWENVGLGGGARKAMKNSLSNTGDDGVTMMAGNSAFSSTRGRERSVMGRAREASARASGNEVAS